MLYSYKKTGLSELDFLNMYKKYITISGGTIMQTDNQSQHEKNTQETLRAAWSAPPEESETGSWKNGTVVICGRTLPCKKVALQGKQVPAFGIERGVYVKATLPERVVRGLVLSVYAVLSDGGIFKRYVLIRGASNNEYYTLRFVNCVLVEEKTPQPDISNEFSDYLTATARSFMQAEPADQKRLLQQLEKEVEVLSKFYSAMSAEIRLAKHNLESFHKSNK